MAFLQGFRTKATPEHVSSNHIECCGHTVLPLLLSCSPASSAGVLLQGLHISGCGGSAVRVSGSLSPAQGVQWGQLPAGLHLVDTYLTSNRGAAGSALSASRAAVYMDAVEVADNTASQLGAGVRIDQGLLVALKTTFTGNKAGSTSQV